MRSRIRNILLVGSLTLSGLVMPVSAASADPCCAPCYGNTDGLFIKDKGRTENGILFANVLNCGPTRKAKVIIRNGPDTDCETVYNRGTTSFLATYEEGRSVQDAKYC